jgi:hypothetical protein
LKPKNKNDRKKRRRTVTVKPEVELKYEFLMEYGGTIQGPYKASEERLIYTVTDGWFRGPKLQGKIVHAGEWMITRASGIHCPDVRATLVTDDNEAIYMHYNGVLIVPDKEGELPFLRTNPLFQASGKYAWLNKVVAVGVGKALDFTTGKIAYDVFAIL